MVPGDLARGAEVTLPEQTQAAGEAARAPEVLTIGHSSLDYATFLERLRAAGVTALADVRSVPRSRQFPHFDGRALKERLAADGIAYVYLGRELGGRPSSPELYRDGVADYEAMAATPAFARGLDRVSEGAARYRVALMCSEGDPTECHRCLLVGRALKGRGMGVSHVMPDGRTVSNEAVEQYLLALTGKLREDLFASQDERLSDAYRLRARRVAYAPNSDEPSAGARY